MNKEEIAQWVIDNRYPKNEQSKMSDAEMYHTLIDKLTTPPPQTVSAEEILGEINKSPMPILLKHHALQKEKGAPNADTICIAMEEYRNQTVKFTPKRTAKEEADRIGITGIIEAIGEVSYAIEALKAANVSTVWHEEVLTILKGM